ncbi:MAG TPA: GAF domain-containing protein, partial [Blastocatellia bacterium]|nr:GAF domain-containing protein [Blastocatellia bacterium]
LPWRGAFFWGGILVGQPIQPFNPETFGLMDGPLSRLGDRLGVALEMERDRAGIEGQDETAFRVFDFTRSVMNSSEDPSPLSSMARDAAALISAGSAAIWRVDRSTSMLQMAGSYGLQSEDFLPLPAGQGLAGSIIDAGQPIALDDAPSDPRCLFPREARENGIVSYLGVPVFAAGEAIGVLEAHSPEPRQWKESDLRLLQSAADFIASALVSAEAAGDRLRVEGAYLGLSEALQRLRSRDELCEAAVEVLGHALGVSRAIAIELDESGQATPVKHEYRAPDMASSVGGVFEQDFVSNALKATAEGEAVGIEDSAQRSLLNRKEAESLNVLSEMIVPVRVDGQVRGFIHLHQCDRVRKWQEDETGFVSRVGRQLSLSLTNIELLEKANAGAEAARVVTQQANDAVNKVRRIIGSLPEAVIGLDQEGRLTFFNDAARDWLGLTNEDVGRMVEMTESLTVTDDSLWTSVLASKSVARFQTGLVRLTGSMGSNGSAATTQGAMPVPVSVSVAPVPNTAGEPGGFLVLICDVAHVAADAEQFTARIAELEQSLQEMVDTLSEARAAESEVRRDIEQLRADAAETRFMLEGLRRQETELRREFEHLREEEAALQKSAQQLLEINRLKSEFIVNAGRELESSLQTVLGYAEILEQGSYGPLTTDQLKAIRSIYASAKHMKQDVEWLIDYGSTRSRRLDTGGEPGGEPESEPGSGFLN